jgi:hypothetical protein
MTPRSASCATSGVRAPAVNSAARTAATGPRDQAWPETMPLLSPPYVPGGRAAQAAGVAAASLRAGHLDRGKVRPNIHVKVGQCIYSVPWKHLGETVDARSTHNPVEFFSTGELIKTHVRKPKGK